MDIRQSQSLVSRLKRRVRLGIIGGGLDSVIGGSHLIAIRADGLADIVAGAMSINTDIAEQSAANLLIDEDRRYQSWREMLWGEIGREDRIDAVVIATPPQFHAEISIAFLNADIHVFCEKPMTSTVAQGEELLDAVKRNDAIFAVNHTFTGYPMVREARQLVQSGAIGTVTLIDGQLAAGDPGVLREPADPAKRHWNLKPAAMGPAVVLGEVGSHAHQMMEFITGLHVTQVFAQLATLTPSREVFDNAYLTVNYAGGAQGRLWASYIAAGNEQGLAFTIHGSEGALKWVEEEPEFLWLLRPGKPQVRITRAIDTTSKRSKDATRVRPGHPEGYLMAFANMYRDFCTAILLDLLGENPAPVLADLPTAEDGLRTIRLIEAAVESNKRRLPVQIPQQATQ